MTTYKPHISEAKKQEVEDVKRLFNEYPVVGIVNLENLPTLQLQRMKKKLKGNIVLKHTKKRFMELAFDALKEKPNAEQLKEKLKGVPALIFTKEDPFSLFKLLKKSQSNAAAKPGQEAPDDLVFPAGPTSFAPGPMIGELGQLGLKTEIVDGKIAVKEDKVLVKEGEVISAKVAELLAKLGIEPMKVGLNLTFTYENGEILGKEVLGVDEEEYIQNIKAAHSESFNVAIFAGYMTSDTAELLINKASREATALAKAGNIQTSETVKEQVAEAESAAKSIEAQMPDVPVEEKKEESEASKEQPKEEQKVEESKPVDELKEEAQPETPQESPKEEESKEEAPAEPEAPKEEAKEEPVELEEKVEEEVEKEEPSQEEAPTGQPQEEPEAPKEEESKEEAPAEPEAPKEEPEKSEAAGKSDEEVAQEVLRELTEGKIKKQEGVTEKAPVEERANSQEPDMNKLINDLKDKKSKGTI